MQIDFAPDHIALCREPTDREMRYSAATAWVRVNSLPASTSV
jgi:hypothetical protein